MDTDDLNLGGREEEKRKWHASCNAVNTATQTKLSSYYWCCYCLITRDLDSILHHKKIGRACRETQSYAGYQDHTLILTSTVGESARRKCQHVEQWHERKRRR
jgi:hypothetical protein